MNWKPIFDRIIVKETSEKEKRISSNIVIPDTANTRRGKVVAVGDKDENGQPLECKEGDTVLIQKNLGTEVDLDGDKYLILRDRDIMMRHADDK